MPVELGSPRSTRRRMAAFLLALAPVVAGACFPSLGDLTSGDGADGGEPGNESGAGGDAESDSGSTHADGALSDAKDRDSLSSSDTSSRDGSPGDAPGGDTSQASGCTDALSSDSANCGSAGHDCLGGACMNCECQPITLATTSGSVGIAIDSTYVYWANTQAGSSGIYKISKALTAPGTPSPVVSGASYANVQGVASDGTYVYWTNKVTAGSVQRALPTGNGQSTLVTGQNQPDWIAVTVDGANVVWTNQGTNQIMSTPVGSVTATPTQLNATNETGTLPAGIAIDSSSVYYATKTSGGGEAEWIPLAGGAVKVLGGATYVGITVDNDNVYWTGGFASPTVSQNTKGGDSTTAQFIAMGGNLTCPLHLVSDGNNVYFFDQGTTTVTTTTEAGTVPAGTVVAGAGALYRIPVGNSAKLPPPIVKGLTDPQALVEDATALYWVTGGTSGAVMKLAK